MLPGSFKGKKLVCGTDSFYIYDRYTSGEISLDEMTGYEGCLYGSAGACPIMGYGQHLSGAVRGYGHSPARARRPASDCQPKRRGMPRKPVARL